WDYSDLYRRCSRFKDRTTDDSRPIEIRSRRRMKTLLLLGSLIAGSSIGEILLAKGMRQVGDVSLRQKELVRALRQMARNPYLFGAITCLAISFFSFIALLSYSDLSFIAPMTSVCYITKTIGAHFFLKERISWERWLGVFSVAFGVALISFEGVN